MSLVIRRTPNDAAVPPQCWANLVSRQRLSLWVCCLRRILELAPVYEIRFSLTLPSDLNPATQRLGIL